MMRVELISRARTNAGAIPAVQVVEESSPYILRKVRASWYGGLPRAQSAAGRTRPAMRGHTKVTTSSLMMDILDLRVSVADEAIEIIKVTTPLPEGVFRFRLDHQDFLISSGISLPSALPSTKYPLQLRMPRQVVGLQINSERRRMSRRDTKVLVGTYRARELAWTMHIPTTTFSVQRRSIISIPKMDQLLGLDNVPETTMAPTSNINPLILCYAAPETRTSKTQRIVSIRRQKIRAGYTWEIYPAIYKKARSWTSLVGSETS